MLSTWLLSMRLMCIHLWLLSVLKSDLLIFKIIPGISPRIDLMLLALICRVYIPIIMKLWVLIMYKVHPTNHTYVQIYMQYIPRIMKTNVYTTTQCTKLECSTFRSVDVLVCRRFGLSTFGYVDVLVCRRFGLSTFWSVDVSVCRRLTSYLQRVHFNTPKPGYKNGHHFADISKWISSMIFFYNFSIQEFNFLNTIYILLYTDLISSIFFQYSNI